MLKLIKKKITNASLKKNPFPYLIIENFISKKDLINLNNEFPDFKNLNEKDVLLPSKSKNKKSILPNSKLHKKLLKKKIFKKLNNSFAKIEPLIKKKFSKEIKKNVVQKYQNSKLKYHMAIAMMKKGYIKSPHTDRRDHLIHCLFYVQSERNSGGDLKLFKSIKEEICYDVFPSSKRIRQIKQFKIKPNFCIFTLNVPWAYHSVSKYNGNKDRKFIYAVYDFKIKLPGTTVKSRKKGFNLNQFWNKKVKVKSLNRKKIFLSE